MLLQLGARFDHAHFRPRRELSRDQSDLRIAEVLRDRAGGELAFPERSIRGDVQQPLPRGLVFPGVVAERIDRRRARAGIGIFGERQHPRNLRRIEHRRIVGRHPANRNDRVRAYPRLRVAEGADEHGHGLACADPAERRHRIRACQRACVVDQQFEFLASRCVRAPRQRVSSFLANARRVGRELRRRRSAGGVGVESKQEPDRTRARTFLAVRRERAVSADGNVLRQFRQRLARLRCDSGVAVCRELEQRVDRARVADFAERKRDCDADRRIVVSGQRRQFRNSGLMLARIALAVAIRIEKRERPNAAQGECDAHAMRHIRVLHPLGDDGRIELATILEPQDLRLFLDCEPMRDGGGRRRGRGRGSDGAGERSEREEENGLVHRGGIIRCHPERSEGSGRRAARLPRPRIPRSARDDIGSLA